MEGARLAPADPNAAPVVPTTYEQGLTSLAGVLPPDDAMQLIALARARGEELTERGEALLLIWEEQQKQQQQQPLTLLATLLGS